MRTTCARWPTSLVFYAAERRQLTDEREFNMYNRDPLSGMIGTASPYHDRPWQEQALVREDSITDRTPDPDANKERTRDAGALPPIERMTSAELLPVVYDELRKLAAARLARERAGDQPMQATSLVHATYLRLIGQAAEDEKAWDGKGHFFAAAALAMRRILVERARQRAQIKRGGDWKRVRDDELSVL